VNTLRNRLKSAKISLCTTGRLMRKNLKKRYPKKYKIWRIAQLINYGLDGEKLDKKEVKNTGRKLNPGLIPTKLYILNISYGGKTILKPIHLKFLE